MYMIYGTQQKMSQNEQLDENSIEQYFAANIPARQQY